MGLFDSVAGAVLGKLGGEQGSMAQMAIELLNQHGGLSGVLDKFKEGGLASQVASWVGTGENMQISGDQIAQVLGNGQLAEMAAKFGITPDVLASQLAQHLPSVVDKLTPDGSVPADTSGILGQLMGMLKS
ncbi:MAG TPA: YidB family protein [Methylophilaceae bacterium]|jgi:uncharacterized protein YidB (DUF937 family)